MTPNEVQDLMLAFNEAVIEGVMGAEMNLHVGLGSTGSVQTGWAGQRCSWRSFRLRSGFRGTVRPV